MSYSPLWCCHAACRRPSFLRLHSQGNSATNMSWRGYISRNLQSVKVLACPSTAPSAAVRCVARPAMLSTGVASEPGRQTSTATIPVRSFIAENGMLLRMLR